MDSSPRPRLGRRLLELDALMSRHAIMVLGMHRSGTSALAGALHHAGAACGGDLMGEGPNNPKGYFESPTVLAHMEALLEACGSFWHDWRPLDTGRAGRARLRALRRGLYGHLDGQFAETPVFTVKDPRICRAYDLWIRVLDTFGAGRTAVLTVRNPVEVAGSLATRNGMTRDKASLLWLRHVLDAERASRGGVRVFTTYEQVMGDLPGVLGRIAATLPAGTTLDVEAGTDFIDPSLRHNRASAEREAEIDRLAPWFLAVWRIMQDYAQTGATGGREAELDAIAAEFERWSLPFADQFAASEWLIGALRQDLNAIAAQASAARRLTPASPPAPEALRTAASGGRAQASPPRP